MKIYTIYRCTNLINNKVYIGFTSETLERRKGGHKRDAFVDGSSAKFHKALREFGWESFVWDVIYQAKEEAEPKESHTCLIMEDYFIKEYNSLEDGYNSAPGGGAWPIMKGEDHPLYGVGHSEKTKKLISEKHHDVSGKNNPMFGKSGEKSPVARKFWATDPFGNYHEGVSIASFCKKHGLTGPLVHRVINGDRPHHKGWKFGYRL